MRRRAHVDANQAEVVDALRAVGATVDSAASMGGGFPDLVVGYKGATFLIEVKNAEGLNGRVRRGQGMTPDQVRWHARWRGHVAVVSSAEEALAAIGVKR